MPLNFDHTARVSLQFVRIFILGETKMVRQHYIFLSYSRSRPTFTMRLPLRSVKKTRSLSGHAQMLGSVVARLSIYLPIFFQLRSNIDETNPLTKNVFFKRPTIQHTIGLRRKVIFPYKIVKLVVSMSSSLYFDRFFCCRLIVKVDRTRYH